MKGAGKNEKEIYQEDLVMGSGGQKYLKISGTKSYEEMDCSFEEKS